MKKSNFSMRAIENMARTAAQKAEVMKTMQLAEQRKVYKKKSTKTNIPHKPRKSNFAAQVEAFQKALASTLPTHEYRIICGGERRNTGKATIKVYKVADMERYPNPQSAPFTTMYVTMYVLYRDSKEQDSLESIAVYGDGALQRCAAISKRRTIFGFPVKHVSIEIGRRPFVDVYLKQNRV